MTPAQQQAIDALRDEGYLVILWTPEELGDIDASYIEDALIERGNEMIEWAEPTTDAIRSYGPMGVEA